MQNIGIGKPRRGAQKSIQLNKINPFLHYRQPSNTNAICIGHLVMLFLCCRFSRKQEESSLSANSSGNPPLSPILQEVEKREKENKQNQVYQVRLDE